MTLIRRCDRCLNNVKNINDYTLIDCLHNPTKISNKRYDLCSDCFQLFGKFMQGASLMPYEEEEYDEEK